MPKKKLKKQKTELTIEMIGGVFAVEKYANGTERRTELPPEMILKLVMAAVEAGLKGLPDGRP